MSFRKLRDILVESYCDGVIDDDEFCILYQASHSKNLEFPYEKYGRFHLEDMSEAECLSEFRFRKDDIHILAEALDIPDQFICDQGSICDGIEGLCLLLRRFSYPCRYSDLIPRFGQPVPVLSMVTNTVMDFIYDTHGHRITQWNNDILNPVQMQTYADAIYNKGAALDNCIGFVDGTVRPICRPGQFQRIVYNGHKRVHALKFQSVVVPNGLIANMYGPVGKRCCL